MEYEWLLAAYAENLIGMRTAVKPFFISSKKYSSIVLPFCQEPSGGGHSRKSPMFTVLLNSFTC